MKRGRTAANRIPISEDTHIKLRDFKNGLDAGASFDDAVLLLLRLVSREGEDEYQTGKRLRQTSPPIRSE